MTAVPPPPSGTVALLFYWSSRWRSSLMSWQRGSTTQRQAAAPVRELGFDC